MEEYTNWTPASVLQVQSGEVDLVSEVRAEAVEALARNEAEAHVV